MSFRPRFPVTNNTYPTLHNNNNNINPSSNISFVVKSNDGYRASSQINFPNYSNMTQPNIIPNPLFTSNSFAPAMHNINKPNHCYNTFVPGQQSINSVPFSSPAPINIRPSRLLNTGSQLCPPPINSLPNSLLNTGSQLSNISAPYNQYYSSQSAEQNPNRNHAVPFSTNCDNTYFNDQRNIPNQNFSHPVQNVAFNNLPPVVNYQGYQSSACLNIPANNMPKTLPCLSQVSVTVNENTNNLMTSAINNSVTSSENMSRPVSQPGIYTNPLTIKPVLINSLQVSSSELQKVYGGQAPSQMLINDASGSCILKNMSNPTACDKEIKLSEFLIKFSITKKKNENQVTVPEFRYAVKAAMYMIKLLCDKKRKLTDLVSATENGWKSEIQSIFDLQKELSAMCSFISAPVYLNNLMRKLKIIKKRRGQKKKTKQNKFSEKIKAEENRKELSQEIDKWLDDIKEKNLKLKREVEMKKEADFILLEVRRKIHEANKTLEKIKVFEKLRNARQTNAVKKGLHILTQHNEKFEKKMAVLKETMLKQLIDYEAEEKALKVMLETEQEGQLEEEAQWKIKKVKTLQQKRQNHINECLFGVSDEPLPTDPLYLFHKYHASSNSNIENLIQIRHQWDVYLAEDGEAVPRQWVVPVAANSTSWEQCLRTSKS